MIYFKDKGNKLRKLTSDSLSDDLNIVNSKTVRQDIKSMTGIEVKKNTAVLTVVK